MFPVVKVKISGLNPSWIYSVQMDFVSEDSHRWKYVNGEWNTCGRAGQDSTDVSTSTSSSTPAHVATSAYTHPDSPNFGHHWNETVVSFTTVKLSNKTHESGQVYNII